MKKIIAVLLAAIMLISFSAAIAGETTLNDAETAGYVLSMFIGDPSLVAADKSSSFDEVNARYIFIGNKDLYCDLGVAIRISDEQMYFWSLDLTPENLIKARLVLDEDAPLCSVQYYEGNEVKDSELYIKRLSSVYPYEAFEKGVDAIVESLSSGEMSTVSGSADPVLDCFPGFSWGMTREEIMDKCGKDMFTEVEAGDSVSLYATTEIFGKSVMILFVFDDNKVNMFSAFVPEEDSNQYFDALSKAYGNPYKTTLTGAMMGKITSLKDDPDGDCYTWKSDKSLIILNGSSIQYWSLY